MVKRCSTMVVLGFVVAMFLTDIANGGEIHSLGGIIQGGSIPIENAAITLTDAVTFSVINTMSSDDDGLFSFNVDDGIYHLFISPPVDSGFKGVIISDVRVIGKDVAQHVVLDTENDSDVNRILTSKRSQFSLETEVSNRPHTSKSVVSKKTSVTDFLFLLPECSVGMCN